MIKFAGGKPSAFLMPINIWLFHNPSIYFLFCCHAQRIITKGVKDYEKRKPKEEGRGL